MQLSYKDTSNFLLGLLILIRKDNFIHQNERDLMLEFGDYLGFEKEIYKPVVDGFLSKKKINETPPKFSSEQITFHFLEEAIKMAFVDDYFHVAELKWLNEVAKNNNIALDEVKTRIDKYLELYPEKKSSL